jgi:hypothetical protein
MLLTGGVKGGDPPFEPWRWKKRQVLKMLIA